MSISLKASTTLMDAVKGKLFENYKLVLNIDGLQEMVTDLENVLDFDFEELRKLNKETLFWYDYLSNIQAVLTIYLDRYKNTKDIYGYLMFLAKKDKTEFMKIAPKYKISTRNLESAIMETTDKKGEADVFVRNLAALIKIFNSYSRYMIFHYYRTSRLVRKSYVSYKNVSDVM